jgi:hypothetical protein
VIHVTKKRVSRIWDYQKSLWQPDSTVPGCVEFPQVIELVEIDRGRLREGFEVCPIRVKHSLAHNPLFEIEALLDAADRLPSSLIECNAGIVPISCPDSGSAGEGLSPRQIVERMRNEKLWLGLKKIDLLPEYREIIEVLLSAVGESISDTHPGINNLEGYVFISSAGTIVPYHMDTEHNFLLQIRGRKAMYMLDHTDPAVLREEDLERYHTNTTRRMRFDLALHSCADEWCLEPGEGMHVPVTQPHYVENGDSLSISLSVTFNTPRQQARARIYKVNHYIRQLGVRPSPYGSSDLRDNLKSAVGLMYQKVFSRRNPISWRPRYRCSQTTGL